MQPYKEYFIERVRCWSIRLAQTVRWRQHFGAGPNRWNHTFQLQRFTVSIKELAEWFGLEVARIVGGRMPPPPRRN
jgi:hypothetical protein